MRGRLTPKSAFELELFDRIVGILWRLRRVPAFEAALLVWIEAREGAQSAHILSSPRPRGDPGGPSASEAAKKQLVLGRAIEAFLKEDFLKWGKLSRYETTLQRQLSAVLKEMREVRASRSESDKNRNGTSAPEWTSQSPTCCASTSITHNVRMSCTPGELSGSPIKVMPAASKVSLMRFTVPERLGGIPSVLSDHESLPNPPERALQARQRKYLEGLAPL